MIGRFFHWLFAKPDQQMYIKEVIREVPVIREAPRGEVVPPPEPLPDDLDTFKPVLRVYTYFDGTKEVRADPMVLFKKWGVVAADLNIDIKIIQAGSKGADEAYDKALKRVRSIFDILPMDQGGLDEDSTFELFYHFVRYIEAVKKNSSGLATKSETSESVPPQPSVVSQPN